MPPDRPPTPGAFVAPEPVCKHEREAGPDRPASAAFLQSRRSGIPELLSAHPRFNLKQLSALGFKSNPELVCVNPKRECANIFYCDGKLT